MPFHETRHPRLLGLAVATLVMAVLTTLTGPPTATYAAATTVVESAVTNPDVLIVAPGRIGTLKMGTSKVKAKKPGGSATTAYAVWGGPSRPGVRRGRQRGIQGLPRQDRPGQGPVHARVW